MKENTGDEPCLVCRRYDNNTEYEKGLTFCIYHYEEIKSLGFDDFISKYALEDYLDRIGYCKDEKNPV